MARTGSLKEAQTALRTAHGNFDAAIENLYGAIVAKDYGAVQTFWKEAHKAMIGLKGDLNGLYRHFGELKPKKGDKLKPGAKLDNAPEGKQVDQKADKRRVEKGNLTGPALPLKVSKRQAEREERRKANKAAHAEKRAGDNRARKAGRTAEVDEPAMTEQSDDAPADDGQDPDAP